LFWNLTADGRPYDPDLLFALKRLVFDECIRLRQNWLIRTEDPVLIANRTRSRGTKTVGVGSCETPAQLVNIQNLDDRGSALFPKFNIGWRRTGAKGKPRLD